MAEEASEHLAELLEHVREGATYTITCDGQAIAKLEPAEVEPTPEEREAAKQRLVARWRSQPAMNAGDWTREELYERDRREARLGYEHSRLWRGSQ